jgi:predicted esterase
MKRIFILSLCTVFLILTAGSLTAQQVFKTTPTSVIGYLEYLPADYNSNSNKYPVVIFLHGIGERGTDTTDPALLETSIQTVTNLGPPKHVKNGTQFPFILISPQLKRSYGTWPSSYVMEVINHVKTYLRIDERRIHVTGLSLGGGGAWVVAQDNPKLFASLSPVCGGYNSPSKACGIAAENLPTWAFHGDKDTIVPISKSITMVNAINACVPTPSPLAIMTTYTGVAHDAWEKAYDPSHTYHNPNVYDWIMSYTNTLTGGNGIPVANAGSDKVVALSSTSVMLTGTATDKEGSISAYSWTKISGPDATLAGTSSSTLTVSGFSAGTYVFRFTATDAAGNTDSDYVKLTVASTLKPVANAGSDKVISLPTNSATITGTATDPDGTISSYAWTMVSGGAATLSGANTSSLSVSGLVAGTYTFRLTATDNNGATHYDDMTLTVNNPPVVSVGADYSITLPANTVTVTGTASDTDGTIASYSWKMTTGTIATLTNTTTPTLTATGLVAGYYVFRLIVKDNYGAWKFDDIAITVKSSSASTVPSNVAPVANAGADKLISLPLNSVSISGAGTDEDGTISSYTWSKTSGGSATLSNTSSSTLNVSELSAGTYTFRLTVTDNAGATHFDDMQLTVNDNPTVSVGADIKLQLPSNSVSVTGTASDSDGAIVSYSWKMTTGTVATLSNVNTPTLTATGLVAGRYVFRLTVKDDRGASKFDDVMVIVNVAPVADAGTDKTITLPTNSLTLNGTGTDTDGSIRTYHWSKISGGTVYFSSAWSQNVSLAGMTEGTYVFRLTVYDNAGGSDTDDVQVSVSKSTTSTSVSTETLTDAPENNFRGEQEISDNSWLNKKVLVFDASGKEVFRGQWSEREYSLLSRGNLYIVHVFDGERKIATEKIYKM